MVVLFSRRTWLIILAIAILGGFMLLCVIMWPRLNMLAYYFRSQTNNNAPPGNKLFEKGIANSQVEKLTASVNDLRENMGFSRAPIPEFLIDSKFRPIILKAIIPAKRYAYPGSWDDIVLGHITLTTKNGENIRVAFCNAGKNPLCYSVDGVHYMRGMMYEPVAIGKREKWHIDEGVRLVAIIYEIHKEQTSNKKSDLLQELIDELERSIGEKPPKRLVGQ